MTAESSTCNMVGVLQERERRDAARRHLDSAEAWLRAIIDRQLLKAFGRAYFPALLPNGTPVIPKPIRERVAGRLAQEPARFPRMIDATELGDAIKIVLHPELYRPYFKAPLQHAYPDGEAEARTFLTRLETHRNKLAHGGVCSTREFEQCACYSNDLIDSIKLFFEEINMARTFNVPTFTRVLDNKGNNFHLTPRPDDQAQFIDVRSRGKGDLYPGEELVVEVEVDESFSGWTVRWLTFNGDHGFGTIVRLPIEDKHVGVQMDIRFEVVSSESWHKLMGGCDDRLDLRYRALPPVIEPN
jgi:hypothetical protein